MARYIDAIDPEYFWGIPARQFAKATVRNTDTAMCHTLRDRMERPNAMYEEIAPEDRYARTYVPEVSRAATVALG